MRKFEKLNREIESIESIVANNARTAEVIIHTHAQLFCDAICSVY